MLRRAVVPTMLAAILLLGLHALAGAQGSQLLGPVDNAVATRGVTAWWGDTYPKHVAARPPCACRSHDPHESALLTCYGAMGEAGAVASRVTTWQWACPEQRAVRCRCGLLQCLCPKAVQSACVLDPCACGGHQHVARKHVRHRHVSHKTHRH